MSNEQAFEDGVREGLRRANEGPLSEEASANIKAIAEQAAGTMKATWRSEAIHDAILLLTELSDSLPQGHWEKGGVIRAIEVLRSEF